MEDKLSTLIKVANDKRLTKWDLFFVDWDITRKTSDRWPNTLHCMKLIGKEEFSRC